MTDFSTEIASHDEIIFLIEKVLRACFTRERTRELALAVTKLEEASHWVMTDHGKFMAKSGVTADNLIERTRAVLTASGMNVKSVTEVPSGK
jgi:hypothetical protein